MPRSVRAKVRREAHHAVPTDLYLVESSFADPHLPDETPGQWGSELEFEVALSLYRHSLRKLTVALSVQSTEDAPQEFTVMYACDFVLSEALEVEAITEAWENLAFDMAPQLLYPYVRAEVSRLTTYSRGGHLVLPFLPVPIKRPADLEIPDPPEDDVKNQLPLLGDGGEETDEG